MLANTFPVGKQADRKHIVLFRGGTLDWNHNKNEIDCVLNSVDIDCLIRHGVKVEVGCGYYWEESKEGLFDKYFDSLKEEKKKQDRPKSSNPKIYNPVLREFCKLMMNSLSFKLAERSAGNQQVVGQCSM